MHNKIEVCTYTVLKYSKYSPLKYIESSLKKLQSIMHFCLGSVTKSGFCQLPCSHFSYWRPTKIYDNFYIIFLHNFQKKLSWRQGQSTSFINSYGALFSWVKIMSKKLMF